MFDVISFGTAAYDVFLKSSGINVGDKEDGRNICVPYGAKLEVNEISFETGGGGTNSATTFSRQGLSCACLVQIGDDYAGKNILDFLKNEKINTDLIDIKKEMITDYSTVLWVPDGGRSILTYRGKTRLEETDIDWEKINSRHFYISSLEGNLNIVEKLTGRFKNDTRFVMWNPGSRELKQKEKVLSLLPEITVLNANREEMAELLAVRENQKEITGLLKEAQKLPCQYIVVTDDKNGAYLWSQKDSFWRHCGIFEDKPRVETTGAGDAFGSGLAAGLIKNLSLEECLYLASANASSVVGEIGAKKGILNGVDLANWPKEKLKIEILT